MKIISATEILKAGGGDAYAKKMGIETGKKRISGGIRLSRVETLRLLESIK
jgi:hypothetical protein